MNETYEEILDVIEEHKRDGFEVPAVRVPDEGIKDLLSDPNFVRPKNLDNFDIENDDSIGIVAGTEIISDDSISAVVADDVKLTEDKYDYETRL